MGSIRPGVPVVIRFPSMVRVLGPSNTDEIMRRATVARHPDSCGIIKPILGGKGDGAKLSSITSFLAITRSLVSLNRAGDCKGVEAFAQRGARDEDPLERAM